MNHHDIVVMFLSLGALLAVARVMGEVAARFGQPMVLGEIVAGILLGPSLLGAIWPEARQFLFPSAGPLPVAMQGITTLSVVLFMLVAGTEVDLSTIWQQGRSLFVISILGILAPFSVGFLAAWIAPDALGRHPGADPLIFRLFLATALSISALPVIAKTLMDLNLYRSDLGMVVIAAAIFDDVAGWQIFAVILGLMGSSNGAGLNAGWTVTLTLAFAAFLFTAGRWIFHRCLPWLAAHASSAGAVLAFAVCAGLLAASFTEWIGTHAIFGAFLVGVALGDSRHLPERTRVMLTQFVSFIFAPLFFASIGMRVDFAAHFDLRLTAIVLGIACLGKIVGCGIGARVCGMPKRESLAVGLAMNSRGAMEIILGLLALEAGIIAEPMFVALVVMALFTSLMSGPLIKRVLRLQQPLRLTDFTSAKTFAGWLRATDRRVAIRELTESVCGAASLDLESTLEAVLAREEIMPTGIGNGLAIPHARLDGLAAPIIGVGLSGGGVDFDAPDGEPAHIVFLILTPQNDDGAQLKILADIARTFSRPEARQQALRAANYTEFLAVLKSGV